VKGREGQLRANVYRIIIGVNCGRKRAITAIEGLIKAQWGKLEGLPQATSPPRDTPD
jgi:hypothetical protein